MVKINTVQFILMISLVVGLLVAPSSAICSVDCLRNCFAGGRGKDLKWMCETRGCMPPACTASHDTTEVTTTHKLACN